MLPFLFGPGQTTHVIIRFICDNARLISDITEVCNLVKFSAYLLIIEKAFDSMIYNFQLRSGFDKTGLKYYWQTKNDTLG